MKKFTLIFVFVVVVLVVLAGCKGQPVTGPTGGGTVYNPPTETPTQVTNASTTATATRTQIAVVNTGTATATLTETATATTTETTTATATATMTNVVTIWNFTLTGTKAETVCVDYDSTQNGYLTGCSKTADITYANGFVATSPDIQVNAPYSLDVWVDNQTGETLYMELYRDGQAYGGPVSCPNNYSGGHLY